jgi:hypothetical protein
MMLFSRKPAPNSLAETVRSWLIVARRSAAYSLLVSPATGKSNE